jgi:uncharacterized protein YkwD
MSMPGRAALAMVLLVAVAACPSGPRKVGGQPSWRKGSGDGSGSASQTASNEPIELAPAAPASRAYNDPPRSVPPSSPVGDAVVAEITTLSTSASLPVPVADGRLFEAARQIAMVVPAEGVIPYPLVEFALQHNGIVEPSPHLLVVWAPADQPGLIVEQLRPRLIEALQIDPIARIGVGAARREGSDVIVVALQSSYLELEPVPRQLGADERVPINARIQGTFKDPDVFVTRDDGTVERLALRVGEGGAIAAELSCSKRRGRQQVEITAADATGSTVLANFPVWCDEAPPTRIAAAVAQDDVEPVTSVEDAERRMLLLVNKDRAAAHLPALELDTRVADVARAHSREMRVTGVVGHVSATTGTAADRVKLGGIRTGLVLENIARAYGIGEAEAGLMNSPGHRANLMSRAATHIGIGIELGEEVANRRELFVTQLFIRIPPPVDPVFAQTRVREQLRAYAKFTEEPSLDRIATTYAQGLATGVPQADAAKRASRELDGVARKFSRVASMVTAISDVEGVDAPSFLGGAQFTHVGIGVAQGDHVDLGPGALHVVVLLAVAR